MQLRSMTFDFLTMSAGFSGRTFAERAATQLWASSPVVDRRAHIGGNAFDRCDDSGVLIRPRGPHDFRTPPRASATTSLPLYDVVRS